MKQDFSRYSERHDLHEVRMDQTINDTKFWLDKYNENDIQINQIKAEFEGKLEALEFQVSRRPTNDDLQKNFKRLNDILLVKFSQVEDVKTGLRDVIAYQKFFYPVQMQNLIGENFAQLKVAQNDL